MTFRFGDNAWQILMERGLLDASAVTANPLTGRGLHGQPADADPSVDRVPQFDAVTDRRVCLHIPEHCERNYAYPLIVWLHGDGGSEQDIQLLMPMISERNYFGISLRGDRQCGQWMGWSDSAQAVSNLQNDLFAAVTELRRCYCLHTEHVYLAGFGSGATMALRMLLSRPRWFAGTIMLAGRMTAMSCPLSHFRELAGRRLLYCAGSRDRSIDVAEIGPMMRLMHAAALETTTSEFDAGHEISYEMLSNMNYWIMHGVTGAVPGLVL